LVMLPHWTMAQNSLRVTKSTLAGFSGDFMGSFYIYLRKMRRVSLKIAIFSLYEEG
jgi:hypothetical protein